MRLFRGSEPSVLLPRLVIPDDDDARRARECRESWAPEREAYPDEFLSMLPLADA